LQSARERDFERVSVCKSFDLALKIATLQAKAGQTVLLSPASASFDEFSSYEERGDAFAEYVQTIAKEKSKIATVDMDEAERE
jgi:UDP-N-acetylmuramoylalanine--D-glutamate ligase